MKTWQRKFKNFCKMTGTQFQWKSLSILTMKNRSISSIQNSGRSHKSISKTQEHETKQEKWITQRQGGSPKFLEFWENVAAATIGNYLVNPIFSNQIFSQYKNV